MKFLQQLIHLQQRHQTSQWMKLPLLMNRCQYHGYTNEPTHPIPDRQPKSMTAEEAVSVVKSGTCIPTNTHSYKTNKQQSLK